MKVWKAGPTNPQHRLFTLLCSLFLLLLCVDYTLYQPVFNPFATILNRIDVAIVCSGSLVMFYFIRAFPRVIFKVPPVAFWVLNSYFSALTIIILFTDRIVAQSSSKTTTSALNPGPLYTFYVASVFLLAGYMLYLIARKYTVLRGRAKQQIRFIAYGIASVIVLNLILNGLLPILTGGYTTYSRFGTSSLLIFVLFTTYGIVTNQLFDIRVFVQKALLYTLLFGSILAFYILVVFLFAQTSGFRASVSPLSATLSVCGALFMGFAFDPLRRWLQRSTDRFLFKKDYDQTEVVASLSSRLANVVAINEAMEIVMQDLVRTLKSQFAVSYVFQSESPEQTSTSQIIPYHHTRPAALAFPSNSRLPYYFQLHPDVVTVSTLTRRWNHLKRTPHTPTGDSIGDTKADAALLRETLTTLEQVQVAVVVPITLNSQMIALLALGPKLSGDPYRSLDSDLLTEVGNLTETTIQKAKLYEGEQMKTEFISIASHELLTPIAAMQGYLSMILHENLGDVDRKARSYLERVYTATQRISLLVKDLLAVSRIDSGKISIVPRAMSAEKAIETNISLLQESANEKKLTLVYEKPGDPLPPLLADPARVDDILSNLLSNAVKYTLHGSVVVRTRPNTGNRTMAIDVVDTGIGIPKEEQLHIFQRFYRIANDNTTGTIGTGFGLYICKTLAEKMGGALTYKSAARRGSTFTLTLPLADEADVRAAEAQAAAGTVPSVTPNAAPGLGARTAAGNVPPRK